MIEVKNLTKRFDGFTALNGLTMTVPTGSVYGLVGPTAQANRRSSGISRAYTALIPAKCSLAASRYLKIRP